MKLMKHITIALVLCAIPAVAVGQAVSCEGCTHQASVYMGDGGFIATAGEDAEMVTWVATCDGVTRSGELMPNDAGVVSALWADALACMAEGGGDFRLGPVTDGGWFWITDADNSAVGNLVALDLFDEEGMPHGDAVDVADAGDSIETMAGKGAVYLKHTATGRVGILPTLLAEPPPADPVPATKCGFGGTAAAPTRLLSNCMLGDGGTQILATSTNAISGAVIRVNDGDTVERPGGSGQVTIIADVWSNGSGHFTTDTSNDARRGNPGSLGANFSSRDHRLELSSPGYALSVGSDGPGGGQTIASGTPMAGVNYTEADHVATITVAADPAYCSKTNNHSATVTVTASMDDTAAGSGQLTPPVARAATGAVGSTKFTVVCPAASANMGQELVPENPFPTE